MSLCALCSRPATFEKDGVALCGGHIPSQRELKDLADESTLLMYVADYHTHSRAFAYGTLASFWREEPDNLLDLLFGWGGGLDPIQAIWDDVAKEMKPVDRRIPDGLSWEVLTLVGGITLVLITCLPPRAPLEPYYVAMLKPSAGRPSRLFTLERNIEGGIFFCEFPASGGHAILGEIETASRSEFVHAIERELKKPLSA